MIDQTRERKLKESINKWIPAWKEWHQKTFGMTTEEAQEQYIAFKMEELDIPRDVAINCIEIEREFWLRGEVSFKVAKE